MVTPRLITIFSIAVLAAFLVSSVEPKIKVKCPSKHYTGKKERYIVLFDKSDQKSTIEKHFEIMKTCWDRRVERVTPNGHKSSNANDKDILSDFSVEGFIHGYSGYFTHSFVVEQLSKMNDNAIIEKDGLIGIAHAISQDLIKRTVVRDPRKNIDRIDQAKRPLDGKFIFPDSAGEGTNIFVIDSGIKVTHDEFGNRARFGAAFCKGCNDQDQNGHGTHVASIAAGSTFGVARKANLIAVGVLNANNEGSTSDLIKGMSFVLREHNKSQNKKSIVNMSLNGDPSKAVNRVVRDLTDAGIHVVVAAGNDKGADACKFSPSSAPSAITVGATEEDSEQIADFSNIGKCLDIFAPGSNIKGAGIENDNAVQIFFGTSQAAPHVTGTIALIISKDGNKSPENMSIEIEKLSTKDIVEGLKNDTLNRFIRTPAP